LEKKLKDAGLEETEISFVVQKDYESLTFQERIDSLFKLPAELYQNIGRNNIKILMEELISTGNKDNLKKIIMHLLAQLGKSSIPTKELLYRILGDFVSLVSPSNYEFDEVVLDGFSALGKRLEEEEASAYPLLLGDVEAAINWIAASASNLDLEKGIMHNRFISLTKLVFALYKRLEVKEPSSETIRHEELIRDLLSGLSKSGLIEILIQQLEGPSLEYNSVIEELVLKFGVYSLGGLIAAITQTADFSFEGYIYRRKVSEILLKIGTPALDKIKEYISIEKDPTRLRILIEIIGYGKEPGLADTLQLLVNHSDPEVKKEVVIALSNIADSNSIRLLSEMSKDIEPLVAHLAKMKLQMLRATHEVSVAKVKEHIIKRWLRKRSQD
jgi:hypothetical protein